MTDVRKVLTRDGKVVRNTEYADGSGWKKIVTKTRCLPETLTITLSGFADAYPDRAEIPLAFSSCFGSGAAGNVGAPPSGSIPSAVSSPVLTAAGSGYAVLGRVEPNMRLTVVGTGEGAELTPVLVEDEDSCGRPIWVIDSVTVDHPGNDYDEYTYIDVQIGNFPDYKAVSDDVSGTDARIRVAWYDNEGEWEVDDIFILAAGSDYEVGDTFTVDTGLTLTVATVGGGGEILSLTPNQTETYPVLESFGSPYLVPDLGRFEPTLTLATLGGGAELTVNMDPLSVDPPLTWTIASVTVVDGGDDEVFFDNDAIFVEENPNNIGESTETLSVRTNRSEPSYDFSGGNSDAIFDTTYTEDGTPPDQAWYLADVTVTDGGTGYYDMEYLSVSPSGYRDIDLYTPVLVVRTERAEPSVHLEPSSVSGSSASISLTLTAGTDFEGRDSWTVTGTSIDNGGSGYEVGDTFVVVTSDGVEMTAGYVEVTTVDDGEITAVSITDAGEYYRDTGIIEEVVIENPGLGYHDDGSIHSVVVSQGGEFWQQSEDLSSVIITDPGESYTEDPAEDPILADVTITVDGGEGTGATFTAEINDDVESPQFGQLSGITLDNGGSGYNATVWIKPCCSQRFDSETIVVKRGQGCHVDCRQATQDYHEKTSQCYATHRSCGLSYFATVWPYDHRRNRATEYRVEYRGPDLPPLVRIEQSQNCASSSDEFNWLPIGATCITTMESTTLVGVGDPLEFTAVSAGGATAVVTEGGEYDIEAGIADRATGASSFYVTASCCPCCGGAAAMPDEITCRVTGVDNLGKVFRFREEDGGPDFGDDFWDEVEELDPIPPIPESDIVLTRDGCRYSGDATISLGEITPWGGTLSAKITITLSAEPCQGTYGQSIQIYSPTNYDISGEYVLPASFSIDHEYVTCNECVKDRCRVVWSIDIEFIAEGDWGNFGLDEPLPWNGINIYTLPTDISRIYTGWFADPAKFIPQITTDCHEICKEGPICNGESWGTHTLQSVCLNSRLVEIEDPETYEYEVAPQLESTSYKEITVATFSIV
jgi:hypothetical protein